jgi:hypothetical protein
MYKFGRGFTGLSTDWIGETATGDQVADPAKFDISRWPNPHISFGAGIRSCLGSVLARLEARVVLTALLERAPKLSLVDRTYGLAAACAASRAKGALGSAKGGLKWIRKPGTKEY